MTLPWEVTIFHFVIRKIDLEDSSELRKVFEVIHQLRTHINLEQYVSLLAQMKHEAYELWVYEEGSEIKGAMGIRSYTDFVRGTHLYIDDLVVNEAHRSQKIGAQLLAFAEDEAKRRKIPSLRLACALSNTGGMKFYEREAWAKRSYNYVKKL